MQDISESIDASSWPCGYEWEIESWVAGGDPDRNAFGNHVLFERLSMLHAKLGGWLEPAAHFLNRSLRTLI
jgi:hypothetical protein